MTTSPRLNKYERVFARVTEYVITCVAYLCVRVLERVILINRGL